MGRQNIKRRDTNCNCLGTVEVDEAGVRSNFVAKEGREHTCNNNKTVWLQELTKIDTITVALSGQMAPALAHRNMNNRLYLHDEEAAAKQVNVPSSTISRKKRKLEEDIAPNPEFQVVPDEFKYTAGGDGHQPEKTKSTFELPNQEEKRTVWIFATEAFLLAFLTAALLYVDGTFVSVPSQFLQLFTCGYWCEQIKFVNSLYVLCTHKDQATYDFIFNWLIDYARDKNVVIQWKQTMSDQEKGLIPSIRYCLSPYLEGDYAIGVCYYHFTSFVFKHMAKYGLKGEYFKAELGIRGFVNKLFALALIDPNDVNSAYVELLDKSQLLITSAIFGQRIRRLIEYFQTYCLIFDQATNNWMPGLWSVSERNIRTNNYIEG